VKILTLDNIAFNLNNLPDEVDDTMRFSVLDNTNPNEPDFFFNSLIFLESFNSPAAVLKIGNYYLEMPLDWSVVVGCKESGNDLEVLPLTSITGRNFDCFIFNPLTSYKTDFANIEIVNIYMDIKWYFPKIKLGNILTVPLHDQENPPCAYFVKEINKQSEVIKYEKLL
jgi:hypothetical protein